MRILIVNPNTTASMTDKAATAARAVAASGTEIIAATSRMGPVSIEGHYDGALAIPGLLAELKERQAAGYDAAVIACFDDTGLEAARTFADVPILGLCESAVVTAGFLAQRFTVVTTLERSRVLIDNLVRRYGMGDRARVRASDIPVLELEDAASGAIGKLRAEIERALSEDGAEAIVLGCAGMTDLARELQEIYGVPVVDGVAAAVKQAEALVSLGLSTSKRGSYASPLPKPFTGAMSSFSPVLKVG
ncbi:aspartate/glutamate racemase family protein [Rhizobium ruizarguesonis]|jgi:allantoin racemase|uniref:Aspartate/glutamate racemase family protein n=1 Tax=Rhizobium ruizarguesonis TaxID=2081791 RepID=A0ABY1XCJ6_9HYPH|nr:aspartate/glutamate racemase family protein [Rhizobium ruizarguesonis]MBY5802899.1 aspartate/glutamate racemase family protein [Rhizobium leguminosarum]NKJ75493.1 aspartate/glutamate racemase family protein [Rhizobium leguminosarum bv. viciae]MBY5843899.1 aspartate/glutamate racemase family protein [Rhizobium leguminosarum]NEH26785.1 aspartate/glutamate racemase family protein [Rhizobium ruizarguesonis]NEH88440.1 aspartate/glutamate racemase family protein [Rhizobium ruizarguesonis]